MFLNKRENFILKIKLRLNLLKHSVVRFCTTFQILPTNTYFLKAEMLYLEGAFPRRHECKGGMQICQSHCVRKTYDACYTCITHFPFFILALNEDRSPLLFNFWNLIFISFFFLIIIPKVSLSACLTLIRMPTV